MSTEHQRFSLANQAETIGQYATLRGYEITRSYFDPGKSGLTLEGRRGLQALLSDVLTTPRDFAVVLVLDVSRWGRFQDHDEAAHYEYVCRNAGVPVIYCAEPFENDQSAVSSLMKRLKRLMAAEFSREQSAKVKQSQLRGARQGRHPSGRAVYGVRRVALRPDGSVRQILGPRERKIFAEDHVVLRPGPVEEVRIVRRIFRRFVEDDWGVGAIVQALNLANIPSATSRPWTRELVAGMLQNELMVGVRVFNRTTNPLQTKASPTPRGAWIRVKVFPPIVSPKLFRAARDRLANRGRLSPAAMLRALTRVWRRHGRLSAALIDAAAHTPGAGSYARQFGSLRNAYAAIGYACPGSSAHQSELQDRYIDALRQAHSRHGYLTERLIEADPLLPSAGTYRRTFGSLLRAYELAGLPFKLPDLADAARARWQARRALGKACGRAQLDDADVLAALQRIFAERGFVSASALRADPRHPQPALLMYRFGSLVQAYARAGLPHDRRALHRSGVRRRKPRRAPEAPTAPT
jgi:DNA invertase Pin-like site-specific DNA recombinase/uncharacterized phage-associated protein